MTVKSCNKDDLPLLKHAWSEVCAGLLSELQPFARSVSLSDTQFQIEFIPSNSRCNRHDSDFIETLTPFLSGLCQNYIVHGIMSRWYDSSNPDQSQLHNSRCDRILTKIVKSLRNAPNVPTRRSQPPI